MNLRMNKMRKYKKNNMSKKKKIIVQQKKIMKNKTLMLNQNKVSVKKNQKNIHKLKKETVHYSRKHFKNKEVFKVERTLYGKHMIFFFLQVGLLNLYYNNYTICKIKVFDISAKIIPYNDMLFKLKMMEGSPVVNFIGAKDTNRGKFFGGIARACFNTVRKLFFNKEIRMLSLLIME